MWNLRIFVGFEDNVTTLLNLKIMPPQTLHFSSPALEVLQLG